MGEREAVRSRVARLARLPPVRLNKKLEDAGHEAHDGSTHGRNAPSKPSEEALTDELSATARGKKSEHYDTIWEKGSFHGEKMCLREGSSPVQRNLRL